MIFNFDNVILRPPEPCDAERLYEFKNDPEVAALLGGFHMGYTLAAITEWIEYHRKGKDEILWIIADSTNGACLGHVGLYKIDHRVRSAEFAIMVGAKDHWGKGLGRKVTTFIMNWGFTELNLHRMGLSVLATNERAIKLYVSLGFIEEGRLRAAQFKGGKYIDVIMMSMLENERKNAR